MMRLVLSIVMAIFAGLYVIWYAIGVSRDTSEIKSLLSQNRADEMKEMSRLYEA